MSRTTRAAGAPEEGGNRRRLEVSEDDRGTAVEGKRPMLAGSRQLPEGRRTLLLDSGPGPSQGPSRRGATRRQAPLPDSRAPAVEEPRRPEPEKAAAPLTIAWLRRQKARQPLRAEELTIPDRTRLELLAVGPRTRVAYGRLLLLLALWILGLSPSPLESDPRLG